MRSERNSELCEATFWNYSNLRARHQCSRKKASGLMAARLYRPNSIDAHQRKDGNFPLGLVLIIGQQGQHLGCRVE